MQVSVPARQAYVGGNGFRLFRREEERHSQALICKSDYLEIARYPLETALIA